VISSSCGPSFDQPAVRQDGDPVGEPDCGQPVGHHTSAMSYLDSNPAWADPYVTNVFAADAVQSAFEMAAVPAEAT
jgi:hypothetical protein